MVYGRFVKDRVSKAIAAQYLAERLSKKLQEKQITSDEIRERLPAYLVGAIEYVTRAEGSNPAA